MSLKKEAGEYIASELQKAGKKVPPNIGELGAATIAGWFFDAPNKLWDFIYKKGFSNEERAAVEKLLAKYGLKVSLAKLKEEVDVVNMLNTRIRGLPKDQQDEFKRDLAEVLDTY